MTKKLTKAEQKYIKDMFGGVCKTIADLFVGEIDLFLENREMEGKKVWPLDHSITEKFMAYHGVPVDVSYKMFYHRYFKKLQRREEAAA